MRLCTVQLLPTTGQLTQASSFAQDQASPQSKAAEALQGRKGGKHTATNKAPPGDPLAAVLFWNPPSPTDTFKSYSSFETHL
jgi:hypothetical protein